MQVKKATKQETGSVSTKKPEHQPDLPETVDPLIEAQKEAKDASDLVATLQAENVKLFEDNSDLLEHNAEMFEKLNAEPQTDPLSTQQLTRNDVILAMLPTINTEHAKTNAEKLAQNIDAICFAFGIEY